MNKTQRIILFAIFLGTLAILYFFNHDFRNLNDTIKVVIISTLIMLSFTSLFLEHFFTTPSDVLASSLAIILLLAPIKDMLNNFGKWYYIYLSYIVAVFIISLFALLLLDSSEPDSSTKNRISGILKSIVVHIGNGRWLFSILFLMSLMFYIDNQSSLFIFLSLYATAIIFIDPKKMLINLSKDVSSKEKDVGEIISVQSRNTFIARLFKNHTPLHRFDLVEFNYSIAQNEQIKKGIIIDNYLLNEQQWIKILSSSEFQTIRGKSDIARHEPNVVYKLEFFQEPDFLKKFVGIVIENSIINKIRFEYASQIKIQEGNLLEINLNDTKILYQVIEGITDTEPLEAKNKAGKIIGEAIQLGVWNKECLKFEKYGWVPEVNTPVFLASDIEEVKIPQNALKIGRIPETNYPLIFDINEAVTHHLAVLGVTGTGKSVFVRNLIREIIKNETKVICVDFTNEYKTRFEKDAYIHIIEKAKEDDLFKVIDILSEELSKFKNQQDSSLIKEKRKFLLKEFQNSIKNFIDSDKSISLFELPDVENTTGILEYTRWFFKALFTLARTDGFDDKKICIVLEEAHTVIPEWNFIGVEEKKAQSLVNAIGQIALQGRKYNIGFIVVAQRTANVSKTVLTQCNSIIAFQQFDKTSRDFLNNYMDEKMANALSSLKFRQASAVGKAFKTGVPIIFEVPEINEKIYENE